MFTPSEFYCFLPKTWAKMQRPCLVGERTAGKAIVTQNNAKAVNLHQAGWIVTCELQGELKPIEPCGWREKTD